MPIELSQIVPCQAGWALLPQPCWLSTTHCDTKVCDSLRRILPIMTAAAWTDAETFQLIELWGDQPIQEQLEGCKKNSQVFAKISEQMSEAGYERTLIQCRDKIKKLRGEYRKIKDSHKEMGNNRKKSKFFDKMNEILHNKPSVSPPVILDTSVASSSAVESPRGPTRP